MDDEALDAAFARASYFFEPPPSIDLAAWIEANASCRKALQTVPAWCGSGPTSAASPTRSPIQRSSASP